MDTEKIANFITTLRKTNNLTQAEFAEMFGVTYQAVSKWENGKNIPDILTLKEICKKFDCDLNEILDEDKYKKNKQKRKIGIIALLIIVLIFISLFFFMDQSGEADDLHFKIITSTCDDFTIMGSMAHNRNQSHIYISRIEYCSGTEESKFIKIDARLYQSIGNTNTLLDSYERVVDEGLTLEEFLREVRFHVDNAVNTCPDLDDTSMFLQIFATDKEDNVISHTIMLNTTSACLNNNDSTSS